MADWWLPRRVFAAARDPPAGSPGHRCHLRGGVRYEDTLARKAGQHPHLATELVPQGLVYPVARYEGLTGHFNSTGALVTGSRQNVDAGGERRPPTIFEAAAEERGLPEEAWVIATNKSFGLMGGSKLRANSDHVYLRSVILLVQRWIETIKSAVAPRPAPASKIDGRSPSR